MIAIPGTTKVHRLEDNFASRDVDFTKEELKEMRELVDAAKPSGHRYNEAGQAMVGH
jgi:aryl-alcohol dehydrogenase-like predicted oxidoreductase